VPCIFQGCDGNVQYRGRAGNSRLSSFLLIFCRWKDVKWP
jgi:hypothetical protein